MLDLAKFCRLIVASGLIREEEPSAQRSGVSSNSAVDFANHLVARQLLTPWQSEKLMQGKWKGFFLDSYKLLGLVGRTNIGLRYRADDTPTGKIVTMHIGMLVPMYDGKNQYVIEEP